MNVYIYVGNAEISSGYQKKVPSHVRKSYNALSAAILKLKNCPPGYQLALIYPLVNPYGNMNVSNVGMYLSCQYPAAPLRRE